MSKQNIYIIGSCFILIFIVFYKSLACQFLNWDDPKTIYENQIIRHFSLQGFADLFKSNYWSHYQPLTYLSLSIEYYFFKLNPFYYHLDNLLLHIANSILVFLFIKRMIRGSKNEVLYSILITFLFALHPQKVESVTWAAERKDVLYSFFYLLSLNSYLRYVQQEEGKKYLIISLLCFVFACLSKSMAVSFAMVVIAVDVFQHRKITRNLILEKLLFIGIAIASGILASQLNGAAANIANTNYFNILERGFNALHAFCWYIQHLVFPFDLCAYIPFYEPGYFEVYYPGVFEVIILLLMLGFIIFFRKNRFMWFGLLFFIANLALTFQLIPYGRVLVADRYTYLSSIGFWIFLSSPFYHMQIKKIYLSIPITLILLYSVLTYHRQDVWANSEVFWDAVLEKYPMSSVAMNKKGEYNAKQKNFELAAIDFQLAYSINKEDFEILNNMGNIHLVENKAQEASHFYERSLAIYNQQPITLSNLGIAYAKLENIEKAEQCFFKSLALNPNNAEVYYNLGKLYKSSNKAKKSEAYYLKAIAYQPDYLDAYFNLANLYKSEEAFQQAENYYNKVLVLNEHYAPAYRERGLLYLSVKDTLRACPDLQKGNAYGWENICK